MRMWDAGGRVERLDASLDRFQIGDGEDAAGAAAIQGEDAQAFLAWLLRFPRDTCRQQQR